MHLYTFLRGREILVRRYKENWQDVFLPVRDKWNNRIWQQVVPRKVELVEWVFPGEHLGSVLRTMFECDNTDKMDALKKEFLRNALRKMLNCKRIPKMDLTQYDMLKCRGEDRVAVPWVTSHPIGIKEDKIGEDGTELL